MAVFKTGLDFRGNFLFPSASPSARFVFNADEVGSTDPFPAYPATYIWRAFPRDQDSFWTMLFHADYVTTFTGTERYYGGHPIPDPPDTGAPKWELSICGGDILGSLVQFGRWYTCVLITHTDGVNDSHDFYFDWPDQTKLVSDFCPTKANAANPAIIVGDAPWNVGFECPNAVLRGFQYYDAQLTLAQVQNEVDNPGSFRAPWYINLNPTPSDIQDKSGAGHHPVWVGAERPMLWQEESLVVNSPVPMQLRI